jgi:thiamine biosynthesis lipoprotein
MATRFEIVIAESRPAYARQAAQAVFEEIDRLEGNLSRFLETSDVSRINALAGGDPVRVGIPAFECLRLARRMHAETGGVFDAAIGPLVRCWRTDAGKPRTPTAEEIAKARALIGMNRVELDEKNFTVRLPAAGMCIDLGGIGKGYALDKGAEILREWDIEAALLSTGGSSVLALGAPPGKEGWPVSVGAGADQPDQSDRSDRSDQSDRSDPSDKSDRSDKSERSDKSDSSEAPEASRFREIILLKDRGLGASGTGVKGKHILDPRTGYPAQGPVRAWACAPSAGVADALSTAFMVMKAEETEAWCRKHRDAGALLLCETPAGRKLRRHGSFPAAAKPDRAPSP